MCYSYFERLGEIRTLTESDQYLASGLLEGVAMLLETFTPDNFTAPEREPPRGRRYVRVGELTDNQKALWSLVDHVGCCHEELHAALRMPFGFNPNVSMEHRFYHVAISIARDLLSEDLEQTFPELGRNAAIIDKHWNVYQVLPGWWTRLRRRLRKLWK